MLEEVKYRCPLFNTRKALQKGRLTIGFLGGSITEARVGYNWPEYVTDWFLSQYKNLQIQVENAAIGATGSELGLFRAPKDILQRNCNLVFVEYAVNDYFVDSEIRQKSREGLLRKLLGKEDMDLIFVYHYRREMLEEMLSEKVPASIEELERLAEYYGINSLWTGLHGLRLVQQGRLKLEHWLPDGLHPKENGSRIYGEWVTEFLEWELNQKETGRYHTHKGKNIKEALDKEHWEKAELLSFEQVPFQSPWKLYRSHSIPFTSQILSTTALGARLTFTFRGKGIYLFTNFGKLAGEYEYRIDRGTWMLSLLEQEEWCGDSGWIREKLLAYPLVDKEHTVEIRNIPNQQKGRCGSMLEIIYIGIIK